MTGQRQAESLTGRERHILERAVHAVSEQAQNASAIVDEVYNAGVGGSHPVALQAKMLRLELLNVKADESANSVGSSFTARCGQRVRWVTGLGVTAGHWAHREPAPHGEPAI